MESEIDIFSRESLKPVRASEPETVAAEPKSMDEMLHGSDLFGAVMKPKASGPLKERFLIPPFSVLNARDGEWQERKRKWVAMGIKSEVGRGAEAAPGGAPRPACDYSNRQRGDGTGKPMA